MCCYPAADHIITGNLKIILDSRIQNITAKEPKYRFHSNIDFNKCREEIAAALNEFDFDGESESMLNMQPKMENLAFLE